MSRRKTQTTTSDSEIIQCPACGGWLRDLYEYFEGASDGIQIECDYCNAGLSLSRQVSVHYELSKRDKA
jgi:DNA-directed RNA polymerase subunit RPC12/RpoP